MRELIESLSSSGTCQDAVVVGCPLQPVRYLRMLASGRLSTVPMTLERSLR